MQIKAWKEKNREGWFSKKAIGFGEVQRPIAFFIETERPLGFFQEVFYKKEKLTV